MNTDDMETVGIEPTEGSRHRADRVERLRIVSDGTPRSTRVTREGSDEVLMVTGFVLSQPDPGSPLTGSVDVLVPSVDVVADCKVRETSMERERVYAELDRLYLLLALFDRRDGTYIADLVRSAREGFERSAPDMAEDDAWGEFDRLWARRDSAAAVVPVTPTTENPYRGQPLYLEKCVVWDEGWAAGRAAATPDPPDEAAIRADERERLSARVYENGWCPTCGTKTADPGVIPGPDPGACPACGGWRKAGMIHRCPPGATPEDERARIGAEERKRITDLLRDGAARRELRANRPGNAAATTLMASWEALRLAADVIERVPQGPLVPMGRTDDRTETMDGLRNGRGDARGGCCCC